MNSRSLTIILIIIGSIVAIYAQAGEQQNIYFLVIGIVILMLGLFRLSRNIPSKRNNQETFIKEEEEK